MANPRITYVAADGTAATLDFVIPPTEKPKFDTKATRTDAFSTGGKRQTVVLRKTIMFPIKVQAIMDDGEDVPAWQAFLDVACEGTPFNYIQDADNPDNYMVCFLVDTEPKLTYVSPGVYGFSGTFQQEL